MASAKPGEVARSLSLLDLSIDHEELHLGHLDQGHLLGGGLVQVLQLLLQIELERRSIGSHEVLSRTAHVQEDTIPERKESG